MPKYRYEYGKRWDARVPRDALSYLVDKLHVSATDEEIATDITKRCAAPPFTPGLIRQSIAYALECHRRNRGLYAHVMRGSR